MMPSSPAPQTAKSNTIASAHVPYAKGMAEMELVQHVAKGGKFTAQDARIDRTPAQTIKSMAAFSRTEFPALEDKEAPLAFTRKLQPNDRRRVRRFGIPKRCL